MAFMRLCRGFNVYDADFVEYPIYEMTIPTNATVYPWGSGPFPTAQNISAICFDYAPANEDLSPFFPESMPRRNTHEGCIVQNDFYYVQGPSSKIPNQQAFSDVPIGTKPADWDTHFFDYYRRIESGAYTVFDSTANQGVLYANCPPVWDSTAAYYHDDLPIKSRFSQLFTTAAGSTFKVGISTSTMYGYTRWECNINGNSAYGSANQVSCPHYLETAANGLGTGGSLAYPNRLTQNLDFPTSFLHIFVHTVYNDIDYYGYGVVTMSAISDTAHPIQANFCLFSADFWGDSVRDGNPPQGGNWGGNNDRAGGDGTFFAPSDNRGDSTGAYLTNYETSMRSALNDGFNNGGVKIYQIAGQYAGYVIGVLFGQDYFDKFLNSMYNPLSAILSYHMIPTSLRGDAFANNIPLTAGGFNISSHMSTPINFPQINSVKKLHVGSVDIANYFGAYPDFAPHTQAILHLPYIGDITIDINAIMYGTLSVDYFCDNVSGNVAAWVWCSDKDGKCTYKYIVTGNCAYTIPLYSQSQNGGAVGKIMSSGVSLVGGLLSGNAAGAVGGALGIAGGVFDAATTPRNTQTTGGNSGNVSMLGDSVVWLEIIRPQWVNPENYQAQNGIPSQISGKISDFRGGFFQVETVDLENVPATDSEIAELEQMLKDGIYYLNE